MIGLKPNKSSHSITTNKQRNTAFRNQAKNQKLKELPSAGTQTEVGTPDWLLQCAFFYWLKHVTDVFWTCVMLILALYKGLELVTFSFWRYIRTLDLSSRL